ncbi:hypothetical protein B1B_00932 [mine drainage metagenome]|uniref:Uncharacterized protein n=1 Tax=mine drainage metagenome TaxID=410659 RepID=T1D8F2_9ZZZZ
MLDVCFPTTDGRELILTRYTEPEADQKMLLQQLNLTLPAQPHRESPPWAPSLAERTPSDGRLPRRM